MYDRRSDRFAGVAQKLAEDETFDVQVLPAWRPDKAMNLEKPDYLDYLAKLEQQAV